MRVIDVRPKRYGDLGEAIVTAFFFSVKQKSAKFAIVNCIYKSNQEAMVKFKCKRELGVSGVAFFVHETHLT